MTSLPTWLLATVAGLLGLALGSFLNVVAARVPHGRSVVRPPSACPQCGHPIRARDNVPVVSWLLLRGKCRDCRAPISVRYPVVEAVTGLLFAATAGHLGWRADLPAWLFMAAVSVVLSAIDLDVRRLPDRIVLPAYPVALVLGAFGALGLGWGVLGRAALGGGILAALYFTLWFVTGGRGIGYGDVKLAGLVGGYAAWLGWGQLVVAGFGAFLLGGVVGIALVVARRHGWRSALPFGPFMLVALWVAFFVGQPIVDGYLRLTGLN